MDEKLRGNVSIYQLHLKRQVQPTVKPEIRPCRRENYVIKQKSLEAQENHTEKHNAEH